MVAHAFHPSTQEVDASRSWCVWSRPGLHTPAWDTLLNQVSNKQIYKQGTHKKVLRRYSGVWGIACGVCVWGGGGHVVVWHVKALTAKPDILSLILGIQMLEAENWLPQSFFDVHTCAVPSALTQNKWKLKTGHCRNAVCNPPSKGLYKEHKTQPLNSFRVSSRISVRAGRKVIRTTVSCRRKCTNRRANKYTSGAYSAHSEASSEKCT